MKNIEDEYYDQIQAHAPIVDVTKWKPYKRLVVIRDPETGEQLSDGVIVSWRQVKAIQERERSAVLDSWCKLCDTFCLYPKRVVNNKVDHGSKMVSDGQNFYFTDHSIADQSASSSYETNLGKFSSPYTVFKDNYRPKNILGHFATMEQAEGLLNRIRVLDQKGKYFIYYG